MVPVSCRVRPWTAGGGRWARLAAPWCRGRGGLAVGEALSAALGRHDWRGTPHSRTIAAAVNVAVDYLAGATVEDLRRPRAAGIRSSHHHPKILELRYVAGIGQGAVERSSGRAWSPPGCRLPARGQCLTPPWAPPARPGGAVVHVGAPGAHPKPEQRLALGIEVLVVHGAARIANPQGAHGQSVPDVTPSPGGPPGGPYGTPEALVAPGGPRRWRVPRWTMVYWGGATVMISQVNGAPERSIRASAVNKAVWCRSAAAT